MSQTRIRRPLANPELNQDWMMELEHDMQAVQAVIVRLDELSLRAINNLMQGSTTDAGIRLTEIREGLVLLCELMGVKIQT